MATTKARQDVGAPLDEIVITQVIGVVRPNPMGTESMVAAAFLVAGQHIAEYARDGDDIELSFDYGMMHFTASCGPTNPITIRKDEDDYQ